MTSSLTCHDTLSSALLLSPQSWKPFLSLRAQMTLAPQCLLYQPATSSLRHETSTSDPFKSLRSKGITNRSVKQHIPLFCIKRAVSRFYWLCPLCRAETWRVLNRVTEKQATRLCTDLTSDINQPKLPLCVKRAIKLLSEVAILLYESKGPVEAAGLWVQVSPRSRNDSEHTCWLGDAERLKLAGQNT